MLIRLDIYVIILLGDIMIIYKNGYAIVNDLRFRKDTKTGYYLCGKLVNGKRPRLHRYIWELFNGTIPKGYDVHHKDHNKDNNEIDNLELLTKREHIEKHKEELTDEIREKFRQNLNKARIKASEWHKSKEGRKWHSQQYEISLGNRAKKKFICEYCGKEFYCLDNGVNRFCSANCKSRYRWNSGIDNITRICVVCGSEFIVNKYSKKIKCDKCKRKE